MTTHNKQNQQLYISEAKYKRFQEINYRAAQHSYKEALQAIKEIFKQHRWLLLDDENIIFDTQTKLLWENVKKNSKNRIFESLNAAKKSVSTLSTSGLTQWQLATKQQIQRALMNSKFPLREGSDKKIVNQSACYHSEGCMWLDSDYLEDLNHEVGLSVSMMFAEAIANGNNEGITPVAIIINTAMVGKNIEDIISIILRVNKWSFKLSNIAIDDPVCTKLVSCFNTIAEFQLFDENSFVPQLNEFKAIDYISTRLPKLDDLRFTDINQGMWEFYTPKTLRESYIAFDNVQNIRARNPELDIKKGAKVAIDFGTSSTVVAIRQNGRDELLRIGLQEKEFAKNEISENDFENPTVLEFLDIQALLQTWHSEAYRPLVNWQTVHCSHEARNRLRQDSTDSTIVGSMFERLKQWALKEDSHARVRVTDSKNSYEYEFEPLAELTPIKGQPLKIDEDYPDLDPIELYAWFLGMNINWRERGIFLDYYLTFPVAYPLEVKSKILSSFRRGIQRSLPESLIYSNSFDDFSVQEIASEPAAFAASALTEFGIEPSESGVAYAVFDFGGGTTDFDYGIYRLPSDEEYDEGYDDVIEHFGSSGDKYLGGENILENLAYQVFQQNQQVCREKNITFTKPIDADSFIGSERLIGSTQSALTNTTIMMSRLRPFWESANTAQDIVQISLLNREGKQINCELTINYAQLTDFLVDRIQTGLVNFFTAMKSSFENRLDGLPKEIHVLLAGNSSRSLLLQSILGQGNSDDANSLFEKFTKELEYIFEAENTEVNKEESLNVNGDNVKMSGSINIRGIPTFHIHLPLETDSKQPYKPSTKTGVALGLLRISPGETLKVVNHDLENSSDSPFQYYVGTHRRSFFEIGIKRGDNYLDWYELGRVRQSIFPLLYTSQPQALQGISRGTYGLKEINLKFTGDNTKGKKVFGRIISSNTIEVCLTEDIEAINDITDKRMIELK